MGQRGPQSGEFRRLSRCFHERFFAHGYGLVKKMRAILWDFSTRLGGERRAARLGGGAQAELGGEERPIGAVARN